MNRISLFLLVILSLFLGSCEQKPAAQDDGHIVGNGGDYLENLFIQGKFQAIRVLQKLKATPLAELERDSTIGSPADLTTLRDRADDLISTIRESRHEWSQKLPAGCPHSTCGCTLPNRPNTVFLSYDNCRGSKSYGQAGSVLLHESTHALLKSDEPAARQLTSVAYELWANWGHPETPHWRHLSVPRDLGISSEAPVQIGEEIFFLSSEVWRYHPGREDWQQVPLKNRDPQLVVDSESWYFAHNKAHVVSGKAAIYAHCWQTRISKGAGLAIDPKEGLELILPREHAPSSRYRTVQASTGDALFVWGGEQCEEDFAEGLRPHPTYRDGGIYSFETGWTLVSENGAPEYSRTMRAAWSGEELVLWDGEQALHRYHPRTQKWLEPISLGVSSPDWAMGGIEGGVLIITPTHAVIYRGKKKVEVVEISRPPRAIELSDAASYFGADFATFYTGGLMTFELEKLRWRFVAVSPYQRDSYLGHLFFTGAEYVLMPLHFMYREDRYGALFYL